MKIFQKLGVTTSLMDDELEVVMVAKFRQSRKGFMIASYNFLRRLKKDQENKILSEKNLQHDLFLNIKTQP